MRERNAAMRAKRLKAEMELAQTRDQLIDKDLVGRQAAYLLIAFRKAVLRLPQELRSKWGPEVMPELRRVFTPHLPVNLDRCLRDVWALRTFHQDAL